MSEPTEPQEVPATHELRGPRPQGRTSHEARLEAVMTEAVRRNLAERGAVPNGHGGQPAPAPALPPEAGAYSLDSLLADAAEQVEVGQAFPVPHSKKGEILYVLPFGGDDADVLVRLAHPYVDRTNRAATREAKERAAREADNPIGYLKFCVVTRTGPTREHPRAFMPSGELDPKAFAAVRRLFSVEAVERVLMMSAAMGMPASPVREDLEAFFTEIRSFCSTCCSTSLTDWAASQPGLTEHAAELASRAEQLSTRVAQSSVI